MKRYVTTRWLIGGVVLQLLFAPIASRPALANGTTPFQAITRIEARPISIRGIDVQGTLISNCGGEGMRGCLLTPFCAGNYAFWIPVSDPFYKTFLSMAMVSLTTRKPVVLHGSNACNEPGGHEILQAIDLRVPGT